MPLSRPRFSAPSIPVFGAALLTLAYLQWGNHNKAAAVLYLAAAFSGALTVGAVTIVRRKSFARGWWLFSAGILAWACGDLVWALHDVLGVTAVPPQLENAFYVTTYPFLILAMFALPLGGRTRLDTILRQLLDATLLFASAFCALWVFYGDFLLSAGVRDPFAIVYPSLDLALLAVVIRFVFSSGRWPASYRLLVLSLTLLLGADLMWRVMLANGTYSVSSWINTLYMDAYLLAAAAALHPTARAIGGWANPDWGHHTREIWRRVVLLAFAVPIPGVLFYFERARIDDRPELVIVAAAAVLLPLLVLARTADVLRTLRHVAREAETARHRSEAIIAASPVAICVADRSGTVRIWNGAAERYTGRCAEDAVGKPFSLDAAEDADHVEELLRRALAGVPLDRVEMKVRSAGGRIGDIRVSSAPLGTADGEIVFLAQDVTRERRHRAELHELAHRDTLTGLPNRRSFEEQLVAAEEHRAGGTWVVLLDVDNFKSVNDAAGHTVGDDVLRELGAILRRELRYGDFLARLSGDEFAAIFYDVPGAVATQVAERLLECARDFRLDAGPRTIDATMSAGIAELEPTIDGATAFQRADDALYEAKRLGKNRVERWTTGIGSEIESRAWSPIIKDALRDDRIELFLQPIVSLRSPGPTICEALCRLRMPNGRLVEASDFIEAAEAQALIPAIDRRMLEKAAELIAATPTLRIFVNLSPASFQSAAVIRRLERILSELPQQALGIEITERTALLRPNRASTTLARLIDAGAVVAIDDFGLGFTSFNELATLPCHLVKIPAGFVDPSGRDTASDAIARAVTNVAHAYGKEVVIEGIENEEADALARSLRIEYGQGWYYGRPQPAVAPRLELVEAG